MNMSTVEFCEQLVKKFPDLGTIMAEHISDNDEILPHVFMADVTRYVLAGGASRKQIVEFLDKMFSSHGSEVEDLIAVSFVEYLVDSEELAIATQGVEVPHIRAEWTRQRAT